MLIKVKNTNNYPEKLVCNGVRFMIPALTEMDVDELFVGNLPSGVIKVEHTEQPKMLLTEPDSYTIEPITEYPVNTQNLLQESSTGKKKKKYNRKKK